MKRFDNIKAWANGVNSNDEVLASGEFYSDGAIVIDSVKVNGLEIINFLNKTGLESIKKEVAEHFLGKTVCEDSNIKFMLKDDGTLNILEVDIDYDDGNNYRLIDIYEKEMTMKLYEDLKAVFERGEK